MAGPPKAGRMSNSRVLCVKLKEMTPYGGAFGGLKLSRFNGGRPSISNPRMLPSPLSGGLCNVGEYHQWLLKRMLKQVEFLDEEIAA
jgi:hypothetical protein